MVSVEVIEDEETEYYTEDEELMNSEDIPNETGINNNDIESFDGDESLDLTEMELQNMKEKDTMNKEEKDDDDRDYRSDDGNASSDDATNDDDNNDESSNAEEEESEEEDGMDTTESTTLCALCCAGDFCEQQGGRAIIGMSYKCIACKGRFHGFPCSNEKTDDMNGMTCKQCDANDMAWTTDTVEIGKERGNEWQISQRNKMKNQSKKEKDDNKKIGPGPTSIIRQGSKHHERGSGRGRGGRSGTIQ